MHLEQKSLSGQGQAEEKIATQYCTKPAAIREDSPLEAALSYAARGWPVFPCHTPTNEGACSCAKQDCNSVGKHPRTASGVKDATLDEATIRDWWQRWPDANVAIATGKTASIVVLDIDPRNGGDESLELIQSGIEAFPNTVQAITGGGGQHLYFAWTDKVQGNRSGFLPGLDLKTDGGYVIAPPSRHASGFGYVWEVSYHPDQTPIAPMPQSLVELINAKPTPFSIEPSKAQTAKAIPEGQRNDALFKRAIRLCNQGLNADEVLLLVEQLNAERCVPPLPDTEVRQIVESAMKYQPDTSDDDADLPSIVITGLQKRHLAKQAIDSLLVSNQKHLRYFVRGDTLVRVRLRHGAELSVEVMTENILQHALNRSANWFTLGDRGQQASQCPTSVVRDVLAEPDLPFPNLVGISHIPLFTREGQLQTQSGYDPGTGYWLSLAPDLALDSDTPMSCREAMALLLDDCLGDFPFEEPASKAHALAALLLPFVRPMIDEPTPLHLFDASSAGSGKSTLASLVALVATGDNPAMLTEATNQDEWRKRLTAALLGGPSVVVLDNLSRRLDSPDLAAVLTSSIWTDRILGRSELAHLPVQAVWLATGNNVQLSNELTRRTILCRLKPQQERPWERKDYKHPQYPKWVKENRSRLIQAILTLIRHWFDTGQPPGEATLGSYTQWATVIGGILNAAGVSGFLENREALYEQMDDDTAEWRAFVLLWWDAHQGQVVTVSDLWELVSKNDALNERLGNGTDQARKSALGKGLSKLKDRIIGGYQITLSSKPTRKGSRAYYLMPMPP